MAQVSEITIDDFDELFDKFLRDDDPRLGKSDWETLFRPACRKVDTPNLGYKLTHGNKIVGMLGMIESSRIIAGQSVQFCNLHSWFVDEDHRGSSLLLMRPLLRMNDHVITDFTPTPPVIEISKRLGFEVFTIPQRILKAGNEFQNENEQVKVLWDSDIAPNELDSPDRELLEDHRHLHDCHGLSFSIGSSTILMIIKRVTFHWRDYASILYVSDPEKAVAAQNTWQQSIRQKLSVKRIVGPEKYLSPELGGSYRVPFPNPLLYRSEQHGPEVIDSLYSEVSLLGLTTLPGAKTIARQTVRMLNPINWFRKNKVQQ